LRTTACPWHSEVRQSRAKAAQLVGVDRHGIAHHLRRGCWIAIGYRRFQFLLLFPAAHTDHQFTIF
jgi:hypothetical protein